MSGRTNREKPADFKRLALQQIRIDSGFRGPHVADIKQCKDMPSLSEYADELLSHMDDREFPAFSDGYRDDSAYKMTRQIFYDQRDQRALDEQTEFVRENELMSRADRREEFFRKYHGMHQEWLLSRRHEIAAKERKGRKDANVRKMAGRHSSSDSDSESATDSSDRSSGGTG